MNELLVLSENIDDYKKEFNKKNFPDLKTHFAESLEEANKFIHHINIILGNPNLTAKVLHNAQNLKWVQSTFAGVDSLCKQELRKNYILTGVKEIFGPLISEYVFAYILGAERNLFEMKKNQLNCNWQPIPYRSISELTIGIAGLGSIGKHVAKTASHFGMHVLGLKNTLCKVD
jgi:phosphoglycerate dehydrogenase-like enzyme